MSKRHWGYVREAIVCFVYLLVRKFGFPVEEGPPSTDGKCIYLPLLPVDADVNIPKPYQHPEQCEAVCVGCTWHEGAHCLYTDFDSSKRLEIKHQGGLVNSVYQGIEDTRIERRVSQEYRGAGRDLAASTATMVEVGNIKQDLQSPGNVFAQYVDAWGRVYVNDQPALAPLVEKYRARLQEIVGDFGVTRIDSMLSMRYRKLESTDDSCDLAWDMLRLLKELDEEERKKQEQQQQQGANGDPNSGNGNGDPSAAQDGDDGDADGQPSDGDGSDGQGDSTAQAGGDADADGDTDGAGQPDQAGDPGAPGAPPGQQDGEGAGKGKGISTGASQILGDQDVKDEPLVDLAKAMMQVASGAGPKAPHRYDIPLSASADANQFNAVQELMQSEANVLRSRLVNFLLASMEEEREQTFSGKLSSSRLARIPVGDLRVFNRKIETEELDTALCLVMDASGSMRGHRGIEAQKMLVMIGEATSRLDVALEVLSFKSGLQHVEGIKLFETPYRDSLERIGGYLKNCTGGTELGHGLIQAAYRLLARPEKRKVLFALTDGETGDVDLTKAAVNFLARNGIEVVAFGIETNAVAAYFPQHLIVNDATTLGGDVLRCLSQFLKRAA